MIIKFIPDRETLNKLIKDKDKEGIVINCDEFTPPNIAIITEITNINYDIGPGKYFKIVEVPREQIHTFIRFMEDSWK
jgi:hypothetical protein